MKRALEASITMLFVLVVFMGFLAVNPQTSSASAKIEFDTTGLSIGADYIMVNGYFFNNGNREATVKNMIMAVTIYDNQGNQAWYEETAFQDINARVVPGNFPKHKFRIRCNHNLHNDSYKYKVETSIWFEE